MTGNPAFGQSHPRQPAAADGKGVVRIEDRYDTDIDDLWSAITSPDRLARWIGRVEGDLRPAGRSSCPPPTSTATGGWRYASDRGGWW